MIKTFVIENDLYLEQLVKINIITGQSYKFSLQLEKILANKLSNEKIVKLDIDSFLSGANINLSIYENKTIILLYPETFLTSKQQYQFIKLLSKTFLETNTQIFIFTNSPFIINKSANITEQEKYEHFCNNCNIQSPIYKSSDENFVPQIKVYYLPNNTLATKTGAIIYDNLGKQKGRYGYWGKKASLIATKIISEGLNLQSNHQDINTTLKKDKLPYIIICEGQSDQADSLFYNKIFENYNNHPVLFVSSKGSSQAIASFELLNQILFNLEAKFNILMLRDRDHEFPDQTSIIKYQKNFIGRKVLLKRAIECYVYNSETAQLLLKSINKSLTNENKIKMDNLQIKIQNEVENQKLGNDYKEKLVNLFKKITFEYDKCRETFKSKNPNWFESIDVIAPLIDKNTEIYKDLAKIIFE